MEGTPSGPSFTSRKPALYTEQDLQRLPTEIAKLLIAEGVKSMCCVPLLSHNRALGTLNVSGMYPRFLRPMKLIY